MWHLMQEGSAPGVYPLMIFDNGNNRVVDSNGTQMQRNAHILLQSSSHFSIGRKRQDRADSLAIRVARVFRLLWKNQRPGKWKRRVRYRRIPGFSVQFTDPGSHTGDGPLVSPANGLERPGGLPSL